MTRYKDPKGQKFRWPFYYIPGWGLRILLVLNAPLILVFHVALAFSQFVQDALHNYAVEMVNGWQIAGRVQPEE